MSKFIIMCLFFSCVNLTTAVILLLLKILIYSAVYFCNWTVYLKEVIFM